MINFTQKINFTDIPNEIILYPSEDGQTKVEVRMEGETVWLTQEQIAELFQRERSVITKHIGNVFEEEELQEESNVQILHIAGSDRPIKFYSLDVIISVGYRVNSHREKTTVSEVRMDKPINERGVS